LTFALSELQGSSDNSTHQNKCSQHALGSIIPFSLIPFFHYTTNVSLERCQDGHLAKHHPFLSVPCDRGRYRCNPRTVHDRLRTSCPGRRSCDSIISAFRRVSVVPDSLSGDVDPQSSVLRNVSISVWHLTLVHNKTENDARDKCRSFAVAWFSPDSLAMVLK
jgi:uncharacterized Zn-finger protein